MSKAVTRSKQQSELGVGLECRSCGCRHFYVRNTVPLPGGKIRRYRECRNCGRILTTTETAGRL
jgi:hypothetical protein